MAGAQRGGVAVFLNPRSRANRRNPGFARQFSAALGDAGHVYAPTSLEALATTVAALRDAPPDVIAVHGGDGTLHKVVTALGAAFGDAPLPPIALLPGGTMNVVAASLRIGAKPVPFLQALAEGHRAQRPLDLVQRRCLRIGENGDLGFIFGNGIAANFLGEYYADDAYGPRRALWLLTRTLASALVGGAFVRRIFRRFEGEVRVDGALLPLTRFVGVNAATVREVGLGFKLNHRADDDPERFGVLAIHAPPLALAVDFSAVLAGRGVSPSRAFSSVASTLEITTSAASGRAGGDADMTYTIDGDLYRTAERTLRISVGPRIQFVRPHATAALGAAKPPTLLSAPPGDTMEAAR